MDTQGDFRTRLAATILAATHAYQEGVGDEPWSVMRPWRNSARSRARDRVLGVAARAGLARRHYQVDAAAEALAGIAADLDAYARTYELLADEHSRDLLLRLLAHRVAGPWHVRLPVTAAEFTAAGERAAAAARVQPQPPAVQSAYGPLELFELEVGGARLRLHGVPMALAFFFSLEQYAYRRGGTEVAARPGDVVIDGGGGWGDTALYFANAVGPGGRVVSFEFEPGNLAILERNLGENPELAQRIEVTASPLWDTGDETIEFEALGPSTHPGAGGLSVRTRSLDELELDRVDFIKLDIESSELRALRGAEETIRRFRPRMAISAYHRESDLHELPAWIDDLGLGYRLHLDHFSPGAEETVLFCAPAR